MKYCGFTHRIVYVEEEPPKPKQHFHFDIPPGTHLTGVGNWPYTEHSGYFDWVDETEDETLPEGKTPPPDRSR